MPRDELEAARIINALQEVIALRAYVSNILGTVAENESAQNHQEVLFVLIAFRALLMCTLPIQPKKLGVHQVARQLPKYSKELTLLIQPTNKKNGGGVFTSSAMRPQRKFTCTRKYSSHYLILVVLLFLIEYNTIFYLF